MKQEIQSIEIERDFVTLKNRRGSLRVDLGLASLGTSACWLVLKAIALTTAEGSFNLAGVSRNAVEALQSAITEAHRRKPLLESLTAQASQAKDGLAAWSVLATRDAYLTYDDALDWSARVATPNIPTGDDADLVARLSLEQQRNLRQMTLLSADPHKGAEQRNADYVAQQLDIYKVFFDTVESKPLTAQQRQAIVHDEANALIIAGAGTGKTSTVVSKVGYILRKGWAAPEEILLLAFTKKAAEEMKERVHEKLGADVVVRTFHSLGLEIIAQAQCKKPGLCPEAEDSKAKANTIQALVADLLIDDTFRQDLLTFQSSLRRPFKPSWEFQSQTEYTQYLLDVKPRALDGRPLKSYEECEIANWLLTHGINFEYERPYKMDTATIKHRQYKPDFYLTDYGIYIEHWGIDRASNTASFVDRKRYLEGMDWKRRQHENNETCLVETYSWERQEGVLLTNLASKLKGQGVESNPIGAEKTLELMTKKRGIDSFSSLIGTFLSLFKSAGYTFEALHNRTRRVIAVDRAETFLRLFEQLFYHYEAHIHARGEIDFDDMITQAREQVADGTYRSSFRFILVDEFQDVALGRANLILALRNQVRGARVFCVGDDWQSIYRFTGSDITVTTVFDKWFGFTRRTVLDRTFRFHDKLASFSSRFVQKNPTQLPKDLSTETTSSEPGVVVWMTQPKADPFATILSDIAKDGPGSLLVLSRFRHGLPKNLTSLKGTFSSLSITAMTAHASKGLEADYVIAVGLTDEKYGFPSDIADDPVLDIVLAEKEQFEFAEERRLFYVALTRARKRVYLVADADNPSPFVREILSDSEFEKDVKGHPVAASDMCPTCQRGRIVKREGEYGTFYSCSNFPICTYRGTLCSQCKQGRMQECGAGESRCDTCEFIERLCPKCKAGHLLLRYNRSTGQPFMGCSRFKVSAHPCRHTEQAEAEQTLNSMRVKLAVSTAQRELFEFASAADLESLLASAPPPIQDDILELDDDHDWGDEFELPAE